MEVFTGSHSLIGTLLLMVLIGMRKFPGAGGCTGADVNPGGGGGHLVNWCSNSWLVADDMAGRMARLEGRMVRMVLTVCHKAMA